MFRNANVIETISSAGLSSTRSRGHPGRHIAGSSGVSRRSPRHRQQHRVAQFESLLCSLENFKQTRMSTIHMYEAACANTFTQHAFIHETHFVPQHQCNSSDCIHSSFISVNP
jgi:hypothetical protein